MNLPNKLTVGRICIIPFFVFFLAYDVCGDPNTSRIIAAVLFILASVTDFLDGHIARSRNLITDFGKFMDPLADKFLILGAMFAVCYSGYIFDYAASGMETVVSADIIRQTFFWAAIVVVFRELAVTSMLEPVLFPFCKGFLTLVSTALMLIFTVLSGVNYIRTYWKYIDTNK